MHVSMYAYCDYLIIHDSLITTTVNNEFVGDHVCSFQHNLNMLSWCALVVEVGKPIRVCLIS